MNRGKIEALVIFVPLLVLGLGLVLYQSENNLVYGMPMLLGMGIILIMGSLFGLLRGLNQNDK